MIRFVRIIRDAVTWPVRHAVISILIVCLSIVYAVGHVSYLKTMRILYYQGDQLREQDLYGVWKIEKSSAEFLMAKRRTLRVRFFPTLGNQDKQFGRDII